MTVTLLRRLTAALVLIVAGAGGAVAKEVTIGYQIILNPWKVAIAQGAFENNVVVQAQDANGNVLAEAVTTYSSSSVGGPGAWTVTLSVNVAAGTEGKLVAFSPDPTGGAPLSSRTYTVFYGG